MLGYSYNIAEDGINYLIEHNCINRPIEDYIESPETDKIRITSLGRYHIFSLVSVFQYLDAIMIDTPILDDNFRTIMTDKTDIFSRLDRTEKLIYYLDICSENIHDKDLKFFWDEIKNTAIKNIEEIKEKNKLNPT